VLPHPTMSTDCRSNCGCIAFSERKTGSKGYEQYRAALMSRNTAPLSGFSCKFCAGGVHAGGEPILFFMSAKGNWISIAVETEERILTWHENNGGFLIQPVVGRNVFHFLNCWSIFFYQQRLAVDAVDRGTERLWRSRRLAILGSARPILAPPETSSVPEASRCSTIRGHFADGVNS
jgi:hypothetical protein